MSESTRFRACLPVYGLFFRQNLVLHPRKASPLDRISRSNRPTAHEKWSMRSSRMILALTCGLKTSKMARTLGFTPTIRGVMVWMTNANRWNLQFGWKSSEGTYLLGHLSSAMVQGRHSFTNAVVSQTILFQ